MFYDLQSKAPSRLDAFGASVKDGRGNTVSRRLFVTQVDEAGALIVRQPTYLAELAFAPIGSGVSTMLDRRMSEYRAERNVPQMSVVTAPHAWP